MFAKDILYIPKYFLREILNFSMIREKRYKRLVRMKNNLRIDHWYSIPFSLLLYERRNGVLKLSFPIRNGGGGGADLWKPAPVLCEGDQYKSNCGIIKHSWSTMNFILFLFRHQNLGRRYHFHQPLPLYLDNGASKVENNAAQMSTIDLYHYDNRIRMGMGGGYGYIIN